MPDDMDRNLFLKYSGEGAGREFLVRNGIKPSAQLAAKIVRARYAVAAAHGIGASDKIQKQAESQGVYFKDPSGDNATLVVNGREMPSPENIGFTALTHKLENFPIDGEVANIKKDMPTFSHPVSHGKIAPRDAEGNPVAGKQTNGVNKATLGLSGHPKEVGWYVSYHRTGVKRNKLSAEDEKVAKGKSSIDNSKEVSDEEKPIFKRLTASGNRFVDEILFNPQEMPSGLKKANGDEMTNKQVLNMINKGIKGRIAMKGLLGKVDEGDALSRIIMGLRNKFGEFDKYENGAILIHRLVNDAVSEAATEAGLGRNKEDVKHGAANRLGRAVGIEGDEDDPGVAKMKTPGEADLARRVSMREPEPEVANSDTREPVEPESRPQNIRTYKTAEKTPTEIGDDAARAREIERAKAKYNQPQKPVMDKDDLEKASASDLAARRQDFMSKIRGMAGANTPKTAAQSSALSKLRQKFKVA
jgi:hypothetical protein